MEQRDFFISYRSVDEHWAGWIAWQLDAAGYTLYVQAWDFRPGMNFVHIMQTAASTCVRTIAVLSPAYFTSDFTQAEWYSAFAKDPAGRQGLLLPVRVAECDVTGLLGQIIYIDLVGLDEPRAREKLLAGIQWARAKPTVPPHFPGHDKPIYPGQPGPGHHFIDVVGTYTGESINKAGYQRGSTLFDIKSVTPTGLARADIAWSNGLTGFGTLSGRIGNADMELSGPIFSELTGSWDCDLYCRFLDLHTLCGTYRLYPRPGNAAGTQDGQFCVRR